MIDSGLVRSHVEGRCSNLRPTQSRISPSILEYTQIHAMLDSICPGEIASWGKCTPSSFVLLSSLESRDTQVYGP